MEKFFELKENARAEVKTENELKKIFNETEELHEGRHLTDIGIYDSLIDRVEKIIENVKSDDRENAAIETGKEMNTESVQKNTTLEKFARMVKANLYLRRGQRKEARLEIEMEKERMSSVKEDYNSALMQLRSCIALQDENENVPKQEDEKILDWLIHISLGKYFRNMGHFDKRSNFDRAYYEFEKVKKELEDSKGKFSREKTHLWLDAQVNMGRANKNLYKLDAAEGCFYEMFLGLKDKCILKNMKDIEQSILECTHTNFNTEIYQKKLFSDEKLFEKYIDQALIQLTILYRKRRKYKEAEALCKKILGRSEENMDAKNNLGVCLRKQDRYTESKNKFVVLKEENNRFAKINYYKCILREIENGSRKVKDCTKDIEEVLTWKSEEDKECQLLKGCFLLILGKSEEAYKLFENLYENSPYVQEGTMALKAYYNMANSLMEQEKYQQARRILEDILNVCKEDVLAEIDKGWCMMKMNQYASAKQLYLKLVEFKEGDTFKKWEDWEERNVFLKVRKFEKMKILNNLGECFLRTNERDKAKDIFKMVCALEKNNIEAGKFLAECYAAEAEELEREGKFNKAQEKYEKANEKLETVYKEQTGDVQLISNLIIVKTAYIRMCKKGNTEKKETNYQNWLINRLLYYPEAVYLQIACRELAEFLIALEKEGKEDMKKIETLYRAFSRIQPWKEEEGYEAFSHFMDSSAFKRVGAQNRGRILAHLFLIYGAVRQIKEVCRYSPKALEESEEKEILPVHYTSIDVLKILLSDDKDRKPRMRLWNSTYMNDPHEGVSFLKILKAAGKKEVSEVLQACFPHFEGNEERMLSKSRNVYITSFSKETDNLFMWIAYGENAQGCNITFADDFFDIRSRAEGTMGNPIYSDSDYALYRILYIKSAEFENNDIQIVSESLDEDEEKKIKAAIKDIWKYIEDMHAFLQKEEVKKLIDDEKKEIIYGFIADALDEVRFLFKDAEYQGEQEMRLVQYSSNPQYEQNYSIPRMYINVEKDIQIESVRLGSKHTQDDVEKLCAWLYSTEKVNKVIKSERHFR